MKDGPQKQPEFVCRCKKPCPEGQCKDPIKVKAAFLVGQQEFHEKMLGLAARAGYAAMRAYALSAGEDLPLWEDSTEVARRTMVANAATVHVHREVNPAQMHTLWAMQMKQAGWALGEYSEPLRMHPGLVGYDALPEVEQWKLHIFVQTVKAIWVVLS